MRLRRFAIAVALLGVAILAAVSLSLVGPRPAPPPGRLPDALLDLSPAQAVRQATLMAQNKQPSREMLLFQRALLDPAFDRRWDLHYDYASSLNDAAFEVGSRLGLAGPVQGRSVRRIALIVSALGELDTAERIAKSPRAIAIIRTHRAELLETWGFPRDAYESYRAALAVDSTLKPALQGANATALLLHVPTGAP